MIFSSDFADRSQRRSEARRGNNLHASLCSGWLHSASVPTLYKIVIYSKVACLHVAFSVNLTCNELRKDIITSDSYSTPTDGINYSLALLARGRQKVAHSPTGLSLFVWGRANANGRYQS